MPDTPSTSAWPPSLPSVPTSRATRVTSAANDESWSTIVLMVFFSSRISPCASTVIFWVRSPLATAVVTWAMLRTWLVRLSAIELTLSVRSFQVPATPVHLGLAAEHALGADLAGDAGDLVGERRAAVSTIVLMVSASAATSPFASTVIFLDQVAVGHGGGDLGDVAHLAR